MKNMLAVFDEYGLLDYLIHESVVAERQVTAYPLPENYNSDTDKLVLVNGNVVVDQAEYIARYRLKAINKIKEIAYDELEATAWKIDRAKERDLSGIDSAAINDVLADREAVRRATDRLENVINNLESEEDIDAVTFEVTPEDRPVIERITSLAFFSRFTTEEQGAVMTAVQQNPILNALIVSLQLADGVVLTDPRIIAGVQALALAGLISESRVQEILKVE